MMNNNTSMRVLVLGSVYDVDYLALVKPLADRMKRSIELFLYHRPAASLRLLARDLARDGDQGHLVRYGRAQDTWNCGPRRAIGMEEWDVVVLGQDLLSAGMFGTFNSDLEFILDYIADKCPGTGVYFIMPWAWQRDVGGARAADLAAYYENNQAVMYNAIVRSMSYAVTGPDAVYGGRIAGLIPVGASIQKLRADLGDVLCEDGVALTHPAARLAAALTVVTSLYPDSADCGPETAVGIAEDLDAACIRQTYQAVLEVCGRPLIPMEVPDPVRVEDVTSQEDVTVAQSTAPYKLHFPDSAVTEDGTVFVSAYEQVYHYPERVLGDRYGWQGSGRLVIWKSTDNGRSFDTQNPVLVIDEVQLDRWGVAKTLGRYRRWQAGEDYILNADPRDPNFTVVHADLNGDGVAEEVLLHTFCMVNYHEDHQTHSLNMHWSTDGGKTWSVPQQLESVNSPALIKRGDAAVFADGQILVPTYFRNKIILLLMQWGPEQGKWINVHDTVLPDPLPEKTAGYEYNELSFIVPDPAGDVVYGFVRANGAIIRSEDRGRNWQLVGEEEGYIHQPGFTPIDEHRTFVTWARVASPRTVYGKVFYPGASWSDTVKRTIYASPNPSPHDMADPSCRRLADGRIYTVGYDTAYRSIVGTFDDPDSAEFDPVELDETAQRVIIYRGTAPIPASLSLPATFTLEVECDFEVGGRVSVMLPGGEELTLAQGEHGIPAGKCLLGLLVLGGEIYLQVTNSDVLVRDGWRYVTGRSVQPGFIAVSGQNAAVEQVTVSRRLHVSMEPALVGIQGGVGKLTSVVYPKAEQISWQTSDPSVATVGNGVVRYVGPGVARITLEADGARAYCNVTVSALPAEVAPGGERKVLFRDDFESFTPGKNKFWDEMEQRGYHSAGVEPTHYSFYDIANGPTGRCLKLTAYNAGRTWVKVDTPIEGDYTVCFDFTFTGGRTKDNFLYPGHCLYLNLWQESGIHGFLDLTPEGIRCEYQNERAEVVNDPESFHEKIIYPLNVWHSIRAARVNGAIYARVWPKDEQEPEKWDLVCMHTQYKTDNEACFRMQYYAGGPEERHVFIDNLVISQREDK